MSGDKLEAAGGLSKAFQDMSDLLTGAVATLVREGWTEEHARAIVVATYVSNAMRGQQ